MRRVGLKGSVWAAPFISDGIGQTLEPIRAYKYGSVDGVATSKWLYQPGTIT